MCDLGVPLISMRKAAFYCGMFRMNRLLHQVQCVHTPQRVLDLLKGLYSMNNILFTHLLLANANVFPEVGMDSNLSSMTLFICLFN